MEGLIFVCENFKSKMCWYN